MKWSKLLRNIVYSLPGAVVAGYSPVAGAALQTGVQKARGQSWRDSLIAGALTYGGGKAYEFDATNAQGIGDLRGPLSELQDMGADLSNLGRDAQSFVTDGALGRMVGANTTQHSTPISGPSLIDIAAPAQAVPTGGPVVGEQLFAPISQPSSDVEGWSLDSPTFSPAYRSAPMFHPITANPTSPLNVAAGNTPAAAATAAATKAGASIFSDPMGWVKENPMQALALGGTAATLLMSGEEEEAPQQVSGLQNNSATWNQPLPEYNVNRRPRAVNVDKNYGFGPEQLFFENINPVVAAKGGALNTLARQQGVPMGGQSDVVPARLSPGEYIMDADTVASLGDGSTEAGARALDDMRERIRVHKRSGSTKKIPPKAKAALKYLKGAR